ncbi:MAG: TlpA disulfide reductase family protein [Bacteroidota bacterium]|nr:TlpA disulfide reductase family protein [Bacteroidota bacterium]
MKKILAIALVSLILISSWQCGRDKSFTVSGQLVGAENDTISLEEMGEKGINSISTIFADNDGFFTFTDTAANPRFLLLKTRNNYISLLVLNGQSIQVFADLADLNETFTVEGSPESELIWELNKEMQAATVMLDSLGTIYESQQARGVGPDADTWFQRKFQDLLNQQKDFIKGFISEHYASPASLMALSHQIGRQSVLNPATDFAYFAKVDSALTITYPESRMVATLHNWVVGYQQQQIINAAQQGSAGIGAEAPEIKLPNPEGKTITLSSLRGKYVLLDFWAAWCSPCRRENPALVRAYEKFNQKGFEIYQVSLDKTREDWVRAIETDRLNWTHVSDLKYWGSPVAKLYYVKSIPANFLIDPKGEIIATNLRGAALEEILNEIFK